MERIEKHVQSNGKRRNGLTQTLFLVIVLSNTQMAMKFRGIYHQTVKITSGIYLELNFRLHEAVSARKPKLFYFPREN